ncbi:HD domain-containing protein [archaeon]|nr:HD domain-containing protein [archaeon]MBL7057185.1 HD domain-containing protein [Candidatus Woesearchaeota archaeon]
MDKANKQAFGFYVQEWNDEKIKIHSECVIDACLNMANNSNLKKEVFIIAGWIHDIGRKIDKDNHQIISLDFLKKFLTQHPEYEELKDLISDCILNHRTNEVPTTKYGQIFQLADKVALKNDKWLEYKKSKNK